MSIISNLNLTYTRRLRIVEFFQNKEPNGSEERFSKNHLFLPQVETDRDLDNQIDVLNNLNLEKMSKLIFLILNKKNFQSKRMLKL